MCWAPSRNCVQLEAAFSSWRWEIFKFRGNLNAASVDTGPQNYPHQAMIGHTCVWLSFLSRNLPQPASLFPPQPSKATKRISQLLCHGSFSWIGVCSFVFSHCVCSNFGIFLANLKILSSFSGGAFS